MNKTEPTEAMVEAGNCQHCGGELAWTRDWSQPPVRHAVSHPECPVNEDDWPVAVDGLVEENRRLRAVVDQLVAPNTWHFADDSMVGVPEGTFIVSGIRAHVPSPLREGTKGTECENWLGPHND